MNWEQLALNSTFFFVFILSPPSVWAQMAPDSTDINDSLRVLYELKEYDAAIKLVKTEDQLNELGYFYVGLAYYAKSEDSKALYCFKKAYELNPKSPDYHYYMGFTLLYLKKYYEAQRSLRGAIILGRPDPFAYIGRGDAFYALGQPDSAIQNYQEARKFEDCPERAFMRIPEIFMERKRPELALPEYYIARDKLDSSSVNYTNCLYNIGVIEYNHKNYEKSQVALEELVRLQPDDYTSISKLIQAYYAQNKFEASRKYQEMLYKAWQGGRLPEKMQDMYCFDQFEHEGKKVMAFERYAESDDDLHYKHLFFLTEPSGQVSITIQTEHSFAVKVENKRYVVGKTQGENHFTYWQFLHGDKINYKDLKSQVKQILKNEVSPSSFSGMDN